MNFFDLFLTFIHLVFKKLYTRKDSNYQKKKGGGQQILDSKTLGSAQSYTINFMTFILFNDFINDKHNQVLKQHANGLFLSPIIMITRI